MKLPIIHKFRMLGMLLLFHAFFISNAWSAACQNLTDDGRPFFVAKLNGLEFNEFSPGNYRIGQDIQTRTGSPYFYNRSTTPAMSRCANVQFMTAGVTTELANKVHTTSIPGIGVRIKVGTWGFVPFAGPTVQGLVVNPVTWAESALKVDVTLVKTAEITQSGFLAGSYMKYYERASGALVADFRFDPPVRVQLRVPTCTVATPSIDVPMGRIHAWELNGMNSVSARQQNFEIKLACAGGDPTTSVRAFVTLTDGNNANNRGKVLTLQQSGLPNNAPPPTGIGIQILRNGEALSFGPDSSAQGNANQWEAGTIQQGQAEFIIPLQARYIQTADRITAGKARARATFTMSYP